MIARGLRILLRHPWPPLLLALALWAAGPVLLKPYFDGARPLPVDASITTLLPRDSAELKFYESVRRRFGDDEVLLLTWTGDELFSHDALTRLRDFAYVLEGLPGVLHVDSLATALSVHGSEGEIELDETLNTVPETSAALSQLRSEVLASPLLRGNLVAPDGRAAMFIIELDPTLTGAAQFELVDQIEARSRAAAGSLASVLTGPAYARIEISRLLFSDLRRVLPIAIAATVLVAGLAMRTVRGLIMPLISTAGAMTLTVAIFVMAGNALNFVTVIIAPVVFVLGFAYAIHIVTAFDERIAAGDDRAAAVDAAVTEAAGPVTLNAALEVIGFLSLAGSSIDAIRLFGLYAALGIVIAWLGALLGVPAGLKLLPHRVATRTPAAVTAARVASLARFDVRHRRAILICTALLTIASLLMASRIKVGTNYLDVLPQGHRVVTDFQQVNARFDGIVPLKIVIESDVPGHFRDPAQLATVAEFERWLEAQPEIGGVASLVDYLGVLYRAFAPDVPRGTMIPPGKQMIDQLLMLGAGNDVERFADTRYSRTALHARSRVVATADIAALVTRIEARLAALPPHLHGHVTGGGVLLVRAIDNITWGQITSLAITALVIYAVLTVTFGSLRIGALALLPNLVPIAILFGILGVAGIALDVTTSLVAPIVLAIVMDDTVYFLLRFNHEARRSANELAGLEHAMTATVRPVAYSTLGLVAGFLALATSSLVNEVEFGLLAAAVMLIAWLLDLLFTPALASRMHFVTLWETLAVDLGCAAPQQTIPLFHGLSARQARTAAILGSIKVYAAGERIVQQGEAAHEIYVIIEGEAVSRVPHDSGDTELRHLHQGDLLGSASLFHGQHFVNVDAVTPVRALRLGETCLGQIQRRYPRIGAQIYRNLSAIIAQRLRDVAVRL